MELDMRTVKNEPERDVADMIKLKACLRETLLFFNRNWFQQSQMAQKKKTLVIDARIMSTIWPLQFVS